MQPRAADSTEPKGTPRPAEVFLSAVREVAGQPAVDTLQRRLGGLNLSLPAELRRGHPLAAVIGLEAAGRVLSRLRVMGWSRPRVGIPAGASGRFNAVMAEVDRQIMAGEIGTRAIARANSVSERTVFRRRAKLRAEGKLGVPG